jgi:hypothetical protein
VAKLLRDERPALQAALDKFRQGLSGRSTGAFSRGQTMLPPVAKAFSPLRMALPPVAAGFG